MTIQELLCNNSKYMYLSLRKQAEFKMSNIDGIAKKKHIGYLMKTRKKTKSSELSEILLFQIYPPKHVFNARMGILDILQRQKG